MSEELTKPDMVIPTRDIETLRKDGGGCHPQRLTSGEREEQCGHAHAGPILPARAAPPATNRGSFLGALTYELERFGYEAKKDGVPTLRAR